MMREAHSPLSKHNSQTTRPNGQWQHYFSEEHHFAVARPASLVGSRHGPAATDMQALGGSGGVAAVEDSTAAGGTRRGSCQCQ